MIERLLNGWRALAPRERRLVLAAAVVVLLACIHLLLFEPAWKGRERLSAELPRLRAQVAQMHALAAEASLLAAAPRGADTPQAVRAALEASIASAGLSDRVAKLSATGDLIDLRFASVPHADWLDWLDATLRETRLRVVDVSLTRETSPGVVSVRLVLEMQGRDSK